MKTPSIVFVESNTTGTGRLFAAAAREAGYRPVLLSRQPERYSFILQECVHIVSCDTSSIEDLCKSIQGLFSDGPIAGILSSSEYFSGTAATLAQQYGLAGPSPNALETCRNKWNQRRILQSAGFLTPKFERVTSSKAAQEALGRIPLPVVLKPTLGSGSVGVRLCRTAEEVLQHADILLQRTVNERGMAVRPELLIEEYLIGPEFSAEAFAGSVIGITRKHVSQEPFFVELGHDFPADIAEHVHNEIAAVVQQSLKELNLTWGPSHVELRLTARGPAIVEINPRLAGGFIPEIVRHALGIDLLRATVRLAAGEKPELRFERRMRASIRFVTLPKSGTIQAICGVSNASKVKHVVDVQMYRKEGDQVQLANDFRDRIGHIMSCAEQSAGAARAAELGRSQIEIFLQ